MEVLSLWLCSEGVNLKLGLLQGAGVLPVAQCAGSRCTACRTMCNLKQKTGTGLGGEVAVVVGMELAKATSQDYSSKTDFKETERFILQQKLF